MRSEPCQRQAGTTRSAKLFSKFRATDRHGAVGCILAGSVARTLSRGGMAFDIRFRLFVLIALAAVASLSLTMAFLTAFRDAQPDWRQGAPLTTPDLNGTNGTHGTYGFR